MTQVPPGPRRVLITGATGFIGRALVARLIAEGREVRAAVRYPNAPLPAGIEAVYVPDLSPSTDWSVAVRGVEAIVHLAARAHVLDESSQEAFEVYRACNALAALSLAESAAAVGVRRLVFMSSARVHGSRTTGVPFVESSSLAAVDPYGRSKVEAEMGLRAISARTGLEVVVVRPPLVYGPGARGNFARLVRLVARGVPLPLGAARNRRSLIGIDNLVDVVVQCLDHPAAVGETFLVSDGEDLSTPELVRRIAHALGRPARLVSMPIRLLRFAGALSGHGDDVARLLDDFVVDSGHVRTALGWNPPFSLDEGLARTAGGATRAEAARVESGHADDAGPRP